MKGHHDHSIVRYGFTYEYGRFYAKGRVECVSSSRLESMFLPRLTQEASSLLRTNCRAFVRGQLQHYGVDYDEREISGNGALLLKKMLLAGKCDEVPDYIEELKSEMHAEWLARQSDEFLSGHPGWVIEKYFVDRSGEPATTRTTRVVGIPYPLSSNRLPGQLRQAAQQLCGLHHATGFGTTQTIYLGWNRGAVEEAATHHAAEESRANQAKADVRERERAFSHDKYLASIRNPYDSGAVVPSPVGQYMIDCPEIEANYSDDVRNFDLTLEIHETSRLGVYQATFNFGVIEGMMMLCHDEGVLEEFCSENDHEGYDTDLECEDEDKDSDIEDESSDDETAVGSKRKATSTKPGVHPPKKLKMGPGSKPKKYFVRFKSRETGTGQINSDAEKGTITFGAPDLSAFTGKVDMGSIGSGVIFKARKVSACAPELRDSWSCYSEAAYEYARVSRWR
ncbi:hypothetical protein F5144DRAFT_623373 [Chaetomium tenue]|uniref:Uncharacterized protein n=1 Tax=Chaetomium tenue TaxID=1854479 RepID=A0ACB7P443_9PEZI|nr:hypothetical protein F5144DRAFT_623373 [Chaetomium globosum]